MERWERNVVCPRELMLPYVTVTQDDLSESMFRKKTASAESGVHKEPELVTEVQL